jgi:hypothetical protein
MSRITEYLQQREKVEDTSIGIPEEETLTEYFQNQVRVLQTSTKFSKTGEVTPIFGTRHVSETDRAVVACNDYLRMGSGRSLVELYNDYVDAKKRRESIPTIAQRTLYEWSSRHGWAARCREYDAEIEGIKNETAQQILGSGLALSHERVLSLKALAVKLENELNDDSSLWLEDFKQLGRGKDTQILRIVRFNGSLINQFRDTLDDLAKETGGRVNKQEVTGAEGSPLGVGVFSFDDIRTKIVERFERILDDDDSGNGSEPA